MLQLERFELGVLRVFGESHATVPSQVFARECTLNLEISCSYATIIAYICRVDYLQFKSVPSSFSP